ncbi:MAG: dethiobiotin synthase [Phycisphaeraceae bacterium]
MFDQPIQLRTPGLFITATDTGVGKTVATCAIAAALRRQHAGIRIGVCKPFASGCRRDREGLVSPDGEALAHFADTSHPLDVVTPLRFAAPLAPAVAAEQLRESIDDAPLVRALGRIDADSDALLIEGVGGVRVPLDPDKPKVDVIDLIAWLGLPVVIVCRPNLGTLNHTAMTAALLKQRKGVKVAGLIINGYDADVAAHDDPSVESNRRWLSRMTGLPVLAVLPRVREEMARVEEGVLDEAVIEAAETVDWRGIVKRPAR